MLVSDILGLPISNIYIHITCTLNNIIIIYAPPLVFFSTNCDVTV